MVAEAKSSLADTYDLPATSAFTERLLILAFAVFLAFETVEAPLRNAFNLAGAPWLIYLRDVAIVGAMAMLALEQMWRRRLQGAFLLFGVLILFHGIVGFLQCGVPIAVLISMKMLLNGLFGAIFVPVLLKRSRRMALFLLAIWIVTTVGVAIDFAGVPLPWKGAASELGDYKIVINKKWSYYGDDRIGGFARDSVLAGMIAAFLGTYALLFVRSVWVRAVAAVATLGLIYLTTSKGGLVAFLLVVLASFAPSQRTQTTGKFLLVFVFVAMVLLPIILPNYVMPPGETVIYSFYDRIERVWPNGWNNIAQHSWIFGSGFGNIGVGQQFLSVPEPDSGDNLFIFAYGYFGILSVIYLGLPLLAALFLRPPIDRVGRYAILTLIYIFAYGIVVNIIEGPISAFMLGSAIQALALRKHAPAMQSQHAYSNTPTRDHPGFTAITT